jgi:hypothetical protein
MFRLVKARYAAAYIESLLDNRELVRIYGILSVLAKEQPLPQKLWLLCRMLEWEGSTRSGVWQYYETVRADKMARVEQLLGEFGLDELLRQYRLGQATWKEGAPELDKWIDANQERIYEQLFELVQCQRDWIIEQTR